MKVRELMEHLEIVDPDKEVVIQRDFEHGYYTHHTVAVIHGHPGHDGPVLFPVSQHIGGVEKPTPTASVPDNEGDKP